MAYQFDGRDRAARRKAEVARIQAVQGRWDEAIQTNREILESFPRDVEAMNRLGKALIAQHRFDEALEAFQNALKIEPQNAISQRNATRLEQTIAAGMTENAPPPSAIPAAEVTSAMFVEEVGKTYVTDLVRPNPDLLFTGIAPADEVELHVQGREVEIRDREGRRLGQLEPRIALRTAQMVESGNRFRAFVVALTGNTIRVILREVFRNPEARWRVSFPRQATIAAPRPYLRETRLNRELEPDVLYDLEEEEDELEEELEEDEGAEEEAEEDEFEAEHETVEEEDHGIAH
ncbi:MAG TPA: tetratricopeptide repeat protein [Thermomicrobiaceae bacterium]|nr:tetratricopeptide repeat protein [Thermomicrobiaceae bacterium]